MKFFETSKYYSFKKSTYISLRWIAVVGQLISVNFVYFFLSFKFDFITSNLIILLGILLYLTGGVNNPFVIFLLIPSIFSSTTLSFRTNFLLVLLTIVLIILLTFYSEDLPGPISDHFHISPYYHYSIPVSLAIASIFLNYFAMTFGIQSRLRKEALAKMEVVMAKEHELLSLGGQAAAAAHSLGTPLSTIKIITQDLIKQFKGQKDIEKDIELLSSQVERCNEILKRLSLNPVEEDDFIDNYSTMRDYLSEIISSFKEISKKNFIFNFDKDSNVKEITKSIEIVYGLRNFIGNANKFSRSAIYINLKSDSEITQISIEDDGSGYSRDILSKIGEPYLKSNNPLEKSKIGLGLGLFIGKTLLEKNFASINCRNSKTKSGAEVIIRWNNRDLFNI